MVRSVECQISRQRVATVCDPTIKSSSDENKRGLPRASNLHIHDTECCATTWSDGIFRNFNRETCRLGPKLSNLHMHDADARRPRVALPTRGVTRNASNYFRFLRQMTHVVKWLRSGLTRKVKILTQIHLVEANFLQVRRLARANNFESII